MALQPWSWLEVLVFSWPADYESSWTLAGEININGIGLHTGQNSLVTLLPSEKPGFQLSWLDNPNEILSLEINQIRNTPLCTTLEFDNRKLSTVEHLLSALGGCGLSHVHIQVSGEEIPLLDGSALNWVEAIKSTGLQPAKTKRKEPPILENSIVLNRGTSLITATPSDTFKIIGIIDFPYPAIGKQVFSIDLTPENFVKDIAPARTFGFVDQLETLKKSGLIKGGNLDNALVCDGESWVNPPLRFKDEPVRHKILDLIGDLALVGFPKAQILVYRGSHALHADLAASLLQ